MAVVVLFPLVPVMHVTRSRGTSSSHSPETAPHRYARLFELGYLGTIATNAGALDDDVAGQKGCKAVLGRGEHLQVTQRSRRRFVVHQDRNETHCFKTAEAGPPFDSEAPQADRRVS